MRRLILCADDFAQSPAISRGILALIDAGRLSATSVFSLSDCWPELAPELSDRAVDVGLHFNLTEALGQPVRGLGYWLLMSQLRTLSRQQLCHQWLQQIDAFADKLGRLPDYLDGHQHVHALPVVRAAMTDAIALRWPAADKPYIRRPDRLADAGDSAFKGRVLRGCCAGFSGHLQQHGLQGPDWFAGLYSLTPAADFAGLMRHWLQTMPDGGLIMCHPGDPDERPDPISATRPLEWAWLAGDGFADDMASAGVTLSRYTPV
ncbi:ChbG/HpnK family deacetylase [Paludibacterium sp. THUN1379]|uniref:ChbG/HpnK family deacetylase n=1 Tax=Paludibacterium sp. THUN1379 TaxID=3112107 RepID=UPI0030937BD3|nr:ChbG/HpnK family deacetylase [Paludibacterium sp. THUN1379]